MNGSVSPYSAQPLGQGDSLAFDTAWADLLESVICAEAKATINVDVGGAIDMLGPAFLSGMSPAAVEDDLSQFAGWLRRPDKTLLRGPFLVIPALHAADFTCKDWARAARAGMLLGYAAKVRHIVLPPTHDSWRAIVNMTRLHQQFVTVLPTAVSRLLQPGLTFEDLFNKNSASGNKGKRDRMLATKYAPQLAFVQRTQRLTSKRSVLWTANVTRTVHDAIRHGLRSRSDWIIMRQMNVEEAALEYALRIAVIKSDDNGPAYLRRVDAAFDNFCGQALF